MVTESETQALSLAQNLGFAVKRFEDGDVRIDPPRPFLLVTVKQNGSSSRTAIDLSTLARSRFHVVGRCPCCPLLNNTNRDISVTPPGSIQESRCYVLNGASEVFAILDEWKPLRVSESNDFYIFPETGNFLMYASHHDEVYVYSGWLTAKATTTGAL